MTVHANVGEAGAPQEVVGHPLPRETELGRNTVLNDAEDLDDISSAPTSLVSIPRRGGEVDSRALGESLLGVQAVQSPGSDRLHRSAGFVTSQHPQQGDQHLQTGNLYGKHYGSNSVDRIQPSAQDSQGGIVSEGRPRLHPLSARHTERAGIVARKNTPMISGTLLGSLHADNSGTGGTPIGSQAQGGKETPEPDEQLDTRLHSRAQVQSRMQKLLQVSKETSRIAAQPNLAMLRSKEYNLGSKMQVQREPCVGNGPVQGQNNSDQFDASSSGKRRALLCHNSCDDDPEARAVGEVCDGQIDDCGDPGPSSRRPLQTPGVLRSVHMPLYQPSNQLNIAKQSPSPSSSTESPTVWPPRLNLAKYMRPGPPDPEEINRHMEDSRAGVFRRHDCKVPREIWNTMVERWRTSGLAPVCSDLQGRASTDDMAEQLEVLRDPVNDAMTRQREQTDRPRVYDRPHFIDPDLFGAKEDTEWFCMFQPGVAVHEELLQDVRQGLVAPEDVGYILDISRICNLTAPDIIHDANDPPEQGVADEMLGTELIPDLSLSPQDIFPLGHRESKLSRFMEEIFERDQDENVVVGYRVKTGRTCLGLPAYTNGRPKANESGKRIWIPEWSLPVSAKTNAQHVLLFRLIYLDLMERMLGLDVIGNQFNGAKQPKEKYFHVNSILDVFGDSERILSQTYDRYRDKINQEIRVIFEDLKHPAEGLRSTHDLKFIVWRNACLKKRAPNPINQVRHFSSTLGDVLFYAEDQNKTIMYTHDFELQLLTDLSSACYANAALQDASFVQEPGLGVCQA